MLAAIRCQSLTFSSKSLPKSATCDELNCEEEAATDAIRAAIRTLKVTLNFMALSCKVMHGSLAGLLACYAECITSSRLAAAEEE